MYDKTVCNFWDLESTHIWEKFGKNNRDWNRHRTFRSFDRKFVLRCSKTKNEHFRFQKNQKKQKKYVGHVAFAGSNTGPVCGDAKGWDGAVVTASDTST